MPSVFEQAIRTGLSAIRSNAGSPITYMQTSTGVSITIDDAVQGRTRKDNISVGGAEQVVETADFLVKVERFEALGDTDIPEPGDLITRVIDGVTYTWTVEARDFGETAWDWSDTSRDTYRIRTRKDGDGAYEVSQPSGFDLSGNELRAAPHG